MRFLVIFLSLSFSLTTNSKEVRCGWLVNPTPSNIWLIDRDGLWSIFAQGGYTHLEDTSSDDKSLGFAYDAIADETQFVRTNGGYGFSCACMTVDVNNEESAITLIYNSTQQPLKQCLEDTDIINYIPLNIEK